MLKARYFLVFARQTLLKQKHFRHPTIIVHFGLGVLFHKRVIKYKLND